MQHHHAVLGEHLGAASEEPVVEADPDMLEHADGDHPVEFFRDVAIVLQAELDGAAELLLARPDTRQRKLLLRQGDAGNPRAGIFGEIERKPAPAATDVEHAGPRLDPQLGGEVTFFCELGVVEGGRGGIEIGAAVLPVGIEKQRVEPLIEVVVMRDVAARTAAQVELLEPSPCQPQRVERAPPAQGPAVVAAHRQFKQIGDRAFLHHEGAGHIGFAELELGLEQDGELGAPAGKPGRDRGAGSVAEGQDRSARGSEAKGSTTDHSRDQCAQQPVHGAPPQRQGRGAGPIRQD